MITALAIFTASIFLVLFVAYWFAFQFLAKFYIVRLVAWFLAWLIALWAFPVISWLSIVYKFATNSFDLPTR